VVSFTPLPLYPHRYRPRYPLDRRLVGPQGRSGSYEEEEEEEEEEIMIGIKYMFYLETSEIR
jgi:hypothetical protein